MFADNVLALVKEIPRGKVTTYKALGNALGNKAYRAVGNALRHNPNPIIVPCHRVVCSDGSLGGLVEQGDREIFGIIMQKALAISKLCSSDPFCSSAKPENVNLKNGAACHSCLLISETSCECMNNFLDRTMIGSTLSKRRIGFFENNPD